MCMQLSTPEMACGSYKCSVNTNVKTECLQGKYLLSALRYRVSTTFEDNRGKLKRARGHENFYVVDLKSFPAICFHRFPQCAAPDISVLCVHSFACGCMVGALCSQLLPRDRRKAVAQQPNCTNPRNHSTPLISIHSSYSSLVPG